MKITVTSHSDNSAVRCPLRITILQGAFFPVPPVRGGAVEKLWCGLAEAFAGAGHTVTQISRAVPELPTTEVRGGVKHLRAAGYDQPPGTLALKWRDLLYTRRALAVAPAADILVTNTFWSPLLARNAQGAIYVSVERRPKGQMRLYGRAARLRACSQTVADAISAEAPNLSARVRVIPNPLPFAPNEPVPTRTDRAKFLFVGRIHPAKGVELLLQAFTQAKHSGALPPEASLDFVGPADSAQGGGGEGWWRGVLARHARADIGWAGPVYDPERLNAIYRAASVFVYPSLDDKGEAMPIAPLEAMAWGCIPVVSNLACFRDYLSLGINGFVFDHEATNRVERLAAALAQAAQPDAQALRAVAAQVRQTHALAKISARFIEDFYSLTKG
jgi:glycosyltransferase involved in cell wall biosynthesis